jgi:hypothetical protein
MCSFQGVFSGARVCSPAATGMPDRSDSCPRVLPAAITRSRKVLFCGAFNSTITGARAHHTLTITKREILVPHPCDR